MEPRCERNPLAQAGHVPTSSCCRCQLSTTSGLEKHFPLTHQKQTLLSHGLRTITNCFPYTPTKDITGLWIRLIISQYFKLRGIKTPLDGQAGL